MGGAEVGYIIGGFTADILLPAIILIICNFIPAAKRNPKVVYGVCGVLAVAVAAITTKGVEQQQVMDVVIAAILALAFLGWGYSRAAKKAKPV